MLSCRSLPQPPKLLRALGLTSNQSSIRHHRLIVLPKHLLSSVSSVRHDSDVHENLEYYFASDNSNSTSKGWKIRGRLSEDLYHLLNGEGRNTSFAQLQPKEEEEKGKVEKGKVYKKDGRENTQQYPPTLEQHASTTAAAAASTTLPDLLETKIPVQSKETAELLFDGIAPHLSCRHLLRLQTILTKFDSARETKSGAYLISKIIASFQNDSTWVCSLMSNFLVGRDLGGITYCTTKTVEPHTSTPPSSEKQNATADALNIAKPRLENFYKTLDDLWSDPVFPPNSNRLTWERDVEILMRAQEKSSRGPPLWCKPAKNTPGKVRDRQTLGSRRDCELVGRSSTTRET